MESGNDWPEQEEHIIYIYIYKYKKQLLKIEKWSRDGSAKKQTRVVASYIEIISTYV